MNKIQKLFRMKPKDIDYLHFMMAHNEDLKYEVDALEKIIDDHRTGQIYNDSDFVLRVVQAIENNLSKTLTRIRLGSNGADRNTQIILEILNTMIFNSDNKNVFMSTEKAEMYPITKATETVKKRIERFRIAQLEREAKKKEKL